MCPCNMTWNDNRMYIFARILGTERYKKRSD